MKMTAGRIRTALIVLLAAAFVLLGFGAVEVNGASVSDATGYVNSRVGVNVRSGPGTRYKIAFGLGDNAKVTIHEEYCDQQQHLICQQVVPGQQIRKVRLHQSRPY